MIAAIINQWNCSLPGIDPMLEHLVSGMIETFAITEVQVADSPKNHGKCEAIDRACNAAKTRLVTISYGGRHGKITAETAIVAAAKLVIILSRTGHFTQKDHLLRLFAEKNPEYYPKKAVKMVIIGNAR